MKQLQQRGFLFIAFNILFAIVVAGCLFYIASVWRKLSYQTQPRVEMKHLFGRIALGDSQTQVQKSFGAGGYRHLKLRPVKTIRWLIRTPTEFGAGNWELWLDYDARATLVSKRIRTADSMKEKPHEPAPADEVASGRTQPFP